MPRGFPFGTKRPSVDSGYFPTFNRDNVALVDIREEPIERLDATGLHTARAHYDLDVLVYATGFDAMTGSLLRPEIVGRDGRTLAEHWSAGPRTYLGPFVCGFPNLFIVAGPGSPSLLSNVLLSIEQHVDWLAALIAHMHHRRRRHRRGDRAGRTATGCSTSTRAPTRPCTRRRAPTTWATTCRANPACSCRTPAAYADTGESSSASSPTATKA